jgi:hypothetical protein
MPDDKIIDITTRIRSIRRDIKVALTKAMVFENELRLDPAIGGRIDLTGWFNHPIYDEILSKVLNDAFNKYPAYISFNDFPNSSISPDPTTILVELPLRPDTDDRIFLTGSLEGMVNDLIDNMRNFKSQIIEDDPEWSTCKGIVDRLRQIADKLEAAMTKSPTK